MRARVKQAEVDAGERKGLTTEEPGELAKLTRDTRRLHEVKVGPDGIFASHGSRTEPHDLSGGAKIRLSFLDGLSESHSQTLDTNHDGSTTGFSDLMLNE